MGGEAGRPSVCSLQDCRVSLRPHLMLNLFFFYFLPSQAKTSGFPPVKENHTKEIHKGISLAHIASQTKPFAQQW